ncbi:MAG: hypothetical protein ACE5KE_01040 [Methanosarcinales archaeon]
MSNLNVFFLIIGLILGIVIGYIIGYLLERVKEGRLRKKSAGILKNEIEVICEDIKKDFEYVEKFKSSEKPTNIQEERLYLSAFFFSRSVYGTSYYESYMNKIYLFQNNTQKALISFYNDIFKIKRDIGSIRATVENMNIPNEAIKDYYEIQCKFRENALEKANFCFQELDKEKKNKIIIKFKKRTKPKTLLNM